jgi:hypothetical protein
MLQDALLGHLTHSCACRSHFLAAGLSGCRAAPGAQGRSTSEPITLFCWCRSHFYRRDSLAGELLQEREDVARSRARAQQAVEALQSANATLEEVPSELASHMASVQVR